MELSPRLEDHFRNPRRVGRITEATGTGRAENPACGDVVEVFVRVDERRMVDASFLAQGCPATVGGASFVLERAIGAAVGELTKWEADPLMEELGETRATRRHGVAMALRAMKEAVAG